MAGLGASVTPVIVSTRRRTLTNWFGNNTPLGWSNVDRILMVPVVTSIWLSKVVSVPVVSAWTLSRSRTVTGSLTLELSRAEMRGRLLSGVVNTTLIGSIWVMTPMPVGAGG